MAQALVEPLMAAPTVNVQAVVTLMVVVAELVQPVLLLVKVYVMIKLPAPANDGENVLPLTPVPEKIPPVGDPTSVTLALEVVNGP